jgi:hypothetical protein
VSEQWHALERKIFMNYRTRNALTALAVLLTAGSLWAHHSFTAVFDLSQQFTLAGTLTKVDWRNPHIQIFLEAKGDDGKVQAWVIEGMAPSGFRGRNVGKSDFENAIGQTVNLEAARAKDGSLYGLMRQITFPDGRSVPLCQCLP